MHLFGGRTKYYFQAMFLAVIFVMRDYLTMKSAIFAFRLKYYYAHIMRPFKDYVNRALDLIEPLLPLNAILPAHGPCCMINPNAMYNAIANYRVLPCKAKSAPAKKTLLIFYISSYGNTRRMAEAIYEGAMSVEHVRVSLYDLEGSEISPFVDLIEGADGLIFGTPTINGDAV